MLVRDNPLYGGRFVAPSWVVASLLGLGGPPSVRGVHGLAVTARLGGVSGESPDGLAVTPTGQIAQTSGMRRFGAFDPR